MAEYRLIKVDDEFWQRVRIYCIRHKITAKALILKLLKAEIEKD